MSLAIGIHLLAAVPALILGAFMLALPKGTPRHKLMGRTWVAIMLVATLSSFFIQQLRAGHGFSWIHLLSLWTLTALGIAIYSIRRGNVRRHRTFMIGTYLGLCGAAVGALSPGRLVGRFLFGG